MSHFSLAEVQTALNQCLADGFTCFVSYYGKTVRVDLTKNAYGDNVMNLNVKAEGNTVVEAFTKAFNNFPKNPLDGTSKWVDNRLAPPAEDAEFTETPDAS